MSEAHNERRAQGVARAPISMYTLSVMVVSMAGASLPSAIAAGTAAHP